MSRKQLYNNEGGDSVNSTYSREISKEVANTVQKDQDSLRTSAKALTAEEPFISPFISAATPIKSEYSHAFQKRSDAAIDSRLDSIQSSTYSQAFKKHQDDFGDKNYPIENLRAPKDEYYRSNDNQSSLVRSPLKEYGRASFEERYQRFAKKESIDGQATVLDTDSTYILAEHRKGKAISTSSTLLKMYDEKEVVSFEVRNTRTVRDRRLIRRFSDVHRLMTGQ